MTIAPARVPAYALSRIALRRRKINHALWNIKPFVGTVLDASSFTLMITAIRHALNLKRAHDAALRETLIEFADTEITARVLDMIALRIAGGFTQLRAGKPLQQFAGLTDDGEWAPVEIAEMRLGSVRRNKLYLDMTCLVMAGAAVGQEIKQQIPGKFAVAVLSRELGWPQFKARPTHSELVRAWFFGWLVPTKYKTIQIADFKCLPHQQKYNKELRNDRNSPCLRDYRHQCRSCPVGYVECERGTHRYTWIFKDCPHCNKRSIYDPSDPGAKVCLICKGQRSKQFWAEERRSFSGG